MNRVSLLKQLAFLLIICFLFTSCGRTLQTTAKITSSGFACPEPQYPVQVLSTELNAYIWSEYLPEEMIECFQLVYNVKFNRIEYASNEELLENVLFGNTNYDLVQPTDYMVELMVRKNLLQELDHARLPAFENFDRNYLDLNFDKGNKHSIPYLAGTDAIIVNTSAVKNIPQKWADLWRPEYANRMVFTDDMRTLIGVTLLTLGYDVNTTNTAQLAEAGEKLKELIPSISVFDSDSPKDALINGDADLGLVWTGEALLAKKDNPAIQYIYPAEGAILWQDNWAMLAGAPHADAAYAWLNYINQGDVFWLVLKEFPYTNPNKVSLGYAQEHHKDLYYAYIDSPITNMPFSAIENGHRIVDVGESTVLYETIWSAVMNK